MFLFSVERAVLLLMVTSSTVLSENGVKNMLMFIVDDFRPEIGRYAGTSNSMNRDIQTPNIDALAESGVIFTNAHTVASVCGPSRVAMLTSRRPESTHQYHNDGYWRELGGNFTSLPQHLKEAYGYKTIGIGKTYHGDGYDVPFSWSEPYYEAPNVDDWRLDVSWMNVDMKAQDEPLPEGYLTTYAQEQLRELAPEAITGQQPFFMVLGYQRPHLPMYAPSKYFDMYPFEDVQLPANPYASHNQPEISWHSCNEKRNYDDDFGNWRMRFNESMPDNTTLEMRRAYYACTSYIDVLIGDVMQTLDNVGLTNSTAILLVSDHGWKLGEHAQWCKSTNYDLDTRIPFILRVPGRTDAGTVVDSPIEISDIFPTVMDALDLDPVDLCTRDATNQLDLCVEGHSVLRAVDSTEPWKNVAFSQFPRSSTGGNSENWDTMGFAVRTQHYRFVQWVGYNFTLHETDWSTVRGEELYDHTLDPDENNNVYADPDYAQIRQELYDVLRPGWWGIAEA